MTDALLGALLLGDPALLFALEPGQRGSAWDVFAEHAPAGAQVLAAAPLADAAEGPVYASVGARLPEGSLLRPATTLVLPMLDVEGGWSTLQATLVAEEWGAASACGEGCLSWEGGEARQPLVAMRGEAWLQLVFPQRGPPVPAEAPAHWSPPEAPRDTPALQALRLEGTRSALLVRFEALQPWAVFDGSWLRDEAVGYASATTRATLHHAGSGLITSTAPLLSPLSSEFEDLLFREVDEHWEIVGTLTALGAALRPETEPVKVPLWVGPEPTVSVRVGRDLALGAAKAPQPPWLSPAFTAEEARRALERCGSACPFMVLGHPWAFLKSSAGDLLPVHEGSTIGATSAYQLFVVEEPEVLASSTTFTDLLPHKAVLAGAERSLPAGAEVRMVRPGHLQVARGAPLDALFSRTERLPAGATLRSPAPPRGDLLAEVLAVSQEGVSRVTLGDLDVRTEGATFTALPPGVPAPGLTPAAPRTMGSLDAQACVRQLGEHDPSESLAFPTSSGPDAELARRWQLEAPGVVERCLAEHGEDPVVRMLAGSLLLTRALVGGLDEATLRQTLQRACDAGQALACERHARLPAGGLEPLLDPAQGWSLFDDTLVFVGDEVLPSGAARCARTDGACVAASLGPAPERGSLRVQVDPEQDLTALEPSLRGALSAGWGVVELGPGVRPMAIGPAAEPFDRVLRVQIAPDALRVDGRRAASLGAAIEPVVEEARARGEWIELELTLAPGVSSARLEEALDSVSALGGDVMIFARWQLP